MDILNIKRWHWIAISLMAGLAMGYVMQLPRGNWNKAFGDTIIQQHFEDGLLKEQSGLRCFRNLVVYPEQVEFQGKMLPIYIVAGQYFSGKLEMPDGQQVAIWRPRCYIAQTPYRPLTRATAASAAPDSVLAYLASLKDKGVTYTYAWWRDPKWGISVWTMGSLVLIGLIWPSIINLLAFGSIFRPKEAKGADLSQAPVSAAEHKPEITAADMAKVQRMGEELEASLSAQAATTTQAPTAEQHAETRKLAAGKLELAADDHRRDDTEFGKDQDDFYPTERHHRKDCAH